MFQGTVPPAVQAMIHEIVKGWPVTDVFVGCSGNLTIERILTPLGVKLHSNDVSIYSCAAGRYFAGEDFRLEVREEVRDEWGWLEKYLSDPVSKLAVILLGSNMLQNAGTRAGTNTYYTRLRHSWISQWDRVFAKTKQKIEQSGLDIESFYAGDVIEWEQTIPADAGFVAFPPFYAGGYEVMWKGLSHVFDWDEPDYELLDETRMQLLVDQLQSREHWAYGSDIRRPDLEPYLRGIIKTTNRNRPVYMYASSGPIRVVQPRQAMEVLAVPHLAPDQELGDRLELHPINYREYASLRSEFMSQMLPPAAPRSHASVVVAVDGILIGAYAFVGYSPSTAQYARYLPGQMSLLLSDFPVRPTRYKRLSKLILYAVLSREAKLLAEREANRRVGYMMTMAFTERPVSMKYRGIFKLLNRRPAPENPAVNRLVYLARLGDWTLQEGFAEWRARHGHLIEEEAAVV